MKLLLPCTFSSLALHVAMAFLIITSCILKNASESSHDASYQSSSTTKEEQGDPMHYDHSSDDTSTNRSINPDNRLLLVEHFNATNNGQSPLDDGKWVPLGNVIKGKAAGDHFGGSVATSKSGNFVVIGGRKNGDNGDNSGHVQIYQYIKDNDEWDKVGGDILGEKAGDYSGVSVDINDTGDVIIIGSHFNDNRAGHARVFRFINGQWYKQGQDLIGSDTGTFGSSVAISSDGGKVIIGGPYSTGYVKVYEYNEDTQRWGQLGLTIRAEASLDMFGSSVDMDDTGDVIIIGAYNNDGNGKDSGHARVYRYIEGQWVKQGQDLDGKKAGDKFGTSVAISGDGETVIIGGPYHDGNGTDSGYVQVYEYKDDTEEWEQVGEDISGEKAGDHSGQSVDINSAGDVVIVGAPWNDANGSSSGHARVYRLIEGRWSKQGQDLDGRLAGDQFGYDVAISGNGNKVFIGGPTNDVNGIDTGHVRAFILIKPTAHPSPMPSMQPTLPKVPSMAPSSSEYPTFDPSCSDSPLKVITNPWEGRKSARSCGAIAKKPKKFCWLKQIKSHCPYTCGGCDEYGSSDSMGPFIFQAEKKDCNWVHDLNLFQASKLCQNDSINATCRKTCALFVQKCECGDKPIE